MALVIGGLIGGSGGYAFNYYGGTDGRVMKRIKVWAATSRIKAISVWLSDGVEKTFGDPSRPAGEGELRTSEFSFYSGETVTSLSLWGNGAGTRSGWIYFRTSQNRTFDFGMYSWGKKTEYPQSVASGIWVGIRGRSSSDIDALGVVFLQRIQSCQLISVQYPTLQFRDSSGARAAPTGLRKQFNLENTADQDDPSSTQQLDWQLADEVSFNSVSHAWILSNTSTGLLQFINTYTDEMSVQARTPVLAVVNGVVGWQLSASDMQFPSLSADTSVSLPWSRSGSLLPSKSVTLSAQPYVSFLTRISFTGSARVTTSGGTFSFSGLQGTYTGNSYVVDITTK